MIWLGLVPGTIGHALANYLLKVIFPLMVLVFINLEPIIGSLIGYCFGFQGQPTIWTLIGGLMIVAGNIMVTITEFAPVKLKVDDIEPSLEESLLNEINETKDL